MTHSELVLSRLARLERQYDGEIPAPLRRWALSGASPLPAATEARVAQRLAEKQPEAAE